MTTNWRAFLRGAASLFSWMEPRKPYVPLTPKQAAEADARALASDWEAVEGDFRAAIERMEKEWNEKRTPK